MYPWAGQGATAALPMQSLSPSGRLAPLPSGESARLSQRLALQQEADELESLKAKLKDLNRKLASSVAAVQGARSPSGTPRGLAPLPFRPRPASASAEGAALGEARRLPPIGGEPNKALSQSQIARPDPLALSESAASPSRDLRGQSKLTSGTRVPLSVSLANAHVPATATAAWLEEVLEEAEEYKLRQSQLSSPTPLPAEECERQAEELRGLSVKLVLLTCGHGGGKHHPLHDWGLSSPRFD
eukprot:RCo030335